MASNWIKLEVITPDKPEIFRLAEILNIDPDAALGKVIRFWAWADQQMIDGNADCNARGVTKSAIDRISFMAGFADALIQVGWLVENDVGLSLPNFRYCIPGDNLPAEPKAASVAETDGKAFPQPACVALPVQEAATQEDIKTETVADIVQSLPSFTATRSDDLILSSLHMANRELRRAKNHVQKWERVCAALRELNKHRDIVRQITDFSRRVASEK
ncbi:DUF1627 domain-containing protein [Escherichia coli]|nr:DUF1627 domain-containing protein [Escherichia coli]EFM5865043.1 DUF1627 domain-containing protein [Escherichia coli]